MGYELRSEMSYLTCATIEYTIYEHIVGYELRSEMSYLTRATIAALDWWPPPYVFQAKKHFLCGYSYRQ